MQLITNYSHPRILSQLIVYSLGAERSAVAGGVVIGKDANRDLPLGLRRKGGELIQRNKWSLHCVVVFRGHSRDFVRAHGSLAPAIGRVAARSLRPRVC